MRGLSRGGGGRGKGQSEDLSEDPGPRVFCAPVSFPSLARSGRTGSSVCAKTRSGMRVLTLRQLLADKNTPSHTTKTHRDWLLSLPGTLFSETYNRYVFIENTQHTKTHRHLQRPMRRHKYPCIQIQGSQAELSGKERSK